MNQVISLYSSALLSHQSSFHSIIDIPDEILTIILSEVYPEVNKTFGILTMVSKCLTRKIFPSIGQIKKSFISNYKLVKYMSGLTELHILNNSLDLSSFSKNIFSHLEILRIHANMVEQLMASDYLDTFVENPDQHPKSLALPFKMSRLHTIIFWNDQWLNGSTESEYKFIFNQDVIPNISKIVLTRCRMNNIYEFSGLKSLELTGCYVVTQVINCMKLESLVVRYPTISSFIVLSIQSLKHLTLGNSYHVDISGCANLESLDISCVKSVDVRRMTKLKHLTLCMTNLFSEEMLLNISDEFFPSLRLLKYYSCPKIAVTSERVLNTSKIVQGSLRGFMVIYKS